ncbi:Cu(I)-responsive transcriptional regulator [Varunaivibrio sulfuroxidans]|uniref:Cu(I)-responsive transcriptional regulator n=1 Tax=Varunaivibrio sulfuroxidans TaxID=1773489 RepID=A0A4R3JG56_9PROT|nr:Cu(I)-responsive transcriptional regulator [Varunaivibrio sulfuroxidans]TCS64186.1 Cu(I)-responsive transcriptional regulator [Varunaivibrio sulfuroxidans]WES31369.1 Cu(I)-responsive transcriptional regulator [Varunaivibrio sulfuroxidans]
MNISNVAQKSGVPAKTIRYYESIGLIPEAERAENGYRDYDRADVQRLRFIQRARRLGFSVKDVGNLLELWNDRRRASADVKALALKHIQEVETRIEELKSIRETLRHLTESCHGDDRPNCPILDGLAGKGREK